MSYVLALALLGVGYLLGLVFPLPPSRHADIQPLLDARRDHHRNAVRDA